MIEAVWEPEFELMTARFKLLMAEARVVKLPKLLAIVTSNELLVGVDLAEPDSVQDMVTPE